MIVTKYSSYTWVSYMYWVTFKALFFTSDCKASNYTCKLEICIILNNKVINLKKSKIPSAISREKTKILNP